MIPVQQRLARIGRVCIGEPERTAGLELGDRISTKTGERGELLGGLLLIAVGITIASGIL